MVSARKITVDLDLKGDAGSKLAKFGLAVGGIKAGLDILVGGFELAKAALFDFTAEIAKQGDEIAKAGRRTGMTAETFQELTFAANIAGAEMSDVEKGIQRLAKNLNDAQVKGIGPLKDQFDALGISADEFAGLRTDEQFEKIADITAGLTTEQEKLAFAQDALGRGGRKLLPILNEGAAGIRKLRVEARELGIFTNEDALAAEEFADAQLRLDRVLNGVKITIGSELIPVVTEIIDGVRGWLVENRVLLQQKLREFIVKAVAAGRQLAPAIQAVAQALGDLIPVVIDAIEEFGIFYNQTQDLTELLSEEFGPAWDAVAEAVDAATSPFTVMFDVIGKIVDIVGEAIGSLAEMDGIVGSIASTILKVGNLVGAEETERVDERGLIGVKQVQVAGKGGPGATKKRQELKGITLDKSASELKRIASSSNVSPEGRAKAAAFLSVAATREAVVIAAGKQALSDIEVAASSAASASALKRTRAQSKRFDKARRTGGGKKKEEPVTDAELLQLISQAGESGESLTGLIGDRKLPGGVPPVITVTVNNFQQDIDVEIENNVTGVPGTSAEEVANVVTENSREMLTAEFERVKDNLAPPLAI